MNLSRFLTAALALAACSTLRADVRDINNETLASVNQYETSTDVAKISSLALASVTQIASWAPDTTHHAVEIVYTKPSPGVNTWPSAQQSFSATDWSGASGLAVDVYNPASTPVPFFFAVYSGSASFATTVTVPPGASTAVLPFAGNPPAATSYGMAQLPPLYVGATLAPHSSVFGSVTFSAMTKVEFAINPATMTGSSVTLRFDNVRTLKPLSTNDWLSGIVDAYGQFTGRTYAGKVTQDSDLTGQYSSEHSSLLGTSSIGNRDAYGGSTEYSQTATGYFHTYKDSNDKWWLIDPAGNYFYSVGANAVLSRAQGSTMVSQTSRAPMFLGLPSTTDANYGQFFKANDSGSLSGFTTGTTYNHYLANVFTKYGGSSTNPWSAVASSYVTETNLRMNKWGMNTIGAWSGEGMNAVEWVAKSTTPYTVAIGSTTSSYPVNTVAIPGRTAVPDPYDSNFSLGVNARVTWASNTKDSTNTYYTKNDPYFLGYFIDNELGWRSGKDTSDPNGGDQSLALAVLKQVGTPCKNALVAKLKTTYGATWNGSLNTAWGTSFSGWSGLDASVSISASNVNATMANDLKGYISDFATLYFSTVKAAVQSKDPNHMYLGCRFATNLANPYNLTDEVLAAAGQYCDVVSVNFYGTALPSSLASKIAACGAPVLISETTVQANDRDHFCDILSPVGASQSDRATIAGDLLASFAANDSIVGFHWYEWNDEAVAGQPWQGENSNDGFVSITDQPYADLIAQIRSFSEGVYLQRAGAPNP